MSTPGIMAGGSGVDVAAAGQAVEAIHDTSSTMNTSYTAGTTTSYIHHHHNQQQQQQHTYHPQHHYASMAIANGIHSSMGKENHASNNRHFSIMSRSMEGPRSLPVHSPASRPHSNSSTLDRK